jgi:predicted aspartyl protease
LLKLLLFLTIFTSVGVAFTVTVTRFFTNQVYLATKKVLLRTPFKTTVWQTFGSVPEAEIELALQTPQGKISHAFLLDTGAVVSSLPREMAEILGYNLAFLPRQTFKGFGNTLSFAYQGEMNVFLGDKVRKLPVVFTEATGSKSLLGRKGLFDKFTLVVDHRTQLVEIRE